MAAGVTQHELTRQQLDVQCGPSSLVLLQPRVAREGGGGERNRGSVKTME